MRGGNMRINDVVETTDHKKIKELLSTHFRLLPGATYNIFDDGSVGIYGSCELLRDRPPIKKFPIKFHQVTDHLICNAAGLTSLVGCPGYVGGTFECSNNQLISLEGAPTRVVDDFRCYDNPLRSLEGFPKFIGKTFWCSWGAELPLLRSLIATHGVFITFQGITHPVDYIINQFIGHKNLRHAILDCQKALIDAGYAGNAKW
jgi:hypothetical protein